MGKKISTKNPTISSIAKDIISLYYVIGGKSTIEKAIKFQNLLGRRLCFLMEAAEGKISLDSITQGQAILYQESLMDATAIQAATGRRKTVFDSFYVSDPKLLGRSSDRRSKIIESDESQLDWHFQILVQAWASANGYGRLKDLRNDRRFRNVKVCDFEIQKKDGRVELLECKRVHPALETNVNYLDRLINKIISRIPISVKQLNDTASIIGKSKCDKHLILDVTGYSSSIITRNYDATSVKFTGFTELELNKLINEILSPSKDLTQITFCWHSVIWINDKCRAIVQNTKKLLDTPLNASTIDYSGWTVEGYPLSDREYREFRVSSTARSIEWIVTAYNNLSDPKSFWKIGPVEERQEKSKNI